MATYRMNDLAKVLTWENWRRIGGCGLSQIARMEAARKIGPEAHWKRKGITLGDIADASVLADREIARYMTDRMGRAAMVVREYE